MFTQLFDADFPDPSVHYVDGHIYVYGTAQHGHPEPNLQARRATSWDGPWEDLGGLLEGSHSSKIFWAPSNPIEVGGEYRLYYTCESEKPGCLGISMARSSKPGKFEPCGKMITWGEGYSVIDPHVISYAGKHWLYWGSMHQPICCQELNEAGDGFAEGSAPTVVLEPTSNGFTKLLEGFYLEYHEQLDLWYAFTSGNNTWDIGDYAVTCFKSRSPFGPFEEIGVIVAPSDDWYAPGQNSICKVGQEWYFVCHAVRPDDQMILDQVKRVPCVAKIEFNGEVPELRPL